MGVFDELVITTSDGSVVATIARFVGPLERGHFDMISGDWVPESIAQPVGPPGFGVDGAGNPYFDTAGPAEGEAAELWVDPSVGPVDGGIWLEAS